MSIQTKSMVQVADAREQGTWTRLTRSPGRGKDSPLKRALIHLVLIISCIIIVYPVIRVFSTALRPGDQMLSTSLAIIPEGATLDAFHRVLFESSFPNWIFNSLVVSLGTAAVGVLLAASAAYAFSRHSFRGRGFGLTSLFATQMIPGVMLIVPIFVLFVTLSIVGTTRGLVLAYAVTAIPFSAWILKGYFDTVPIDLEEAAQIDGCSELQSFYKVLIPLSVPALAIVFLFNFLAAWGEFFYANIIIGTNRALQTWPVGLVAFQGRYQTEWSTLSASAIFVSIPIVILFIWVSKYLVSGLTLGGVKGSIVARTIALRRRAATVVSLLLLLAVLPAGVSGQDAESPGIDGSIRERDLQHDSRDDLYRAPGGAVPAGTTVHLRMRSTMGDLSGVELRLADRLRETSTSVPMERVASDPDGGAFGYDYWGVEVSTGPESAVLDYHFVAQDGPAARQLADDPSLDGGTGQISRSSMPGQAWQITVYDPDFETPSWAPGSVVYQVFPDRFANADPSNDPSPEATPGPSGAEQYRHGEVHGYPITNMGWDELPEAYCRDYKPEPCAEQAYNRDFFGGDLAGITDALDGLADLGVTVLYLNPIFASPSNHRYDTSDYLYVDPDLGTAEEFETLLAEAGARGIRVVLDGVFNHVSADSPWFDRFRHYEAVGACESADSAYRDWFAFRPPGPGQPQPCAPTTDSGDDTYYVSWWNFDSIPELNEIPEVDEMFVGEDGVVETWIERGTAGWRLDVADSMSHEFQAAIRDAAKGADPEAIVIAEQWHDSTPWLLGDQADSTMNYRFRRAVIALVNGATSDPDGSLAALSPTGFANAMLGVREDYPEPAYQALMNLVDSHDTARILWTLTPGDDNDAAKTEPEALEIGKARQRLIAAVQLTFPGMASIYYGDEVGLTGFDDPDDRRPYPWGAEDLELRAWYRTLALLRASHDAIREGDLEFLMADDARRTLAFLRRSESAAAVVALNLGDRERELEVPVAQRIPDGTVLVDALHGLEPKVVTDGLVTLRMAPQSVAVLVSDGSTDLTAPAAPAGLTATAGSGRVELAWDSVEDAASYRVLRSIVSGGGYEAVGDTVDTAFADESVRDGVPYHYVVVSLDERGNVSDRSNAATAVPQLTIAALEVQGVVDERGAVVNSVERSLSAIDGAVEVEVSVVASAPGERIAEGVVVEVGFAPEEISAIGGPAWVWSPAEAVATAESGATFRGQVHPGVRGGWSAGARASTDGGETWQSALGVGHIVTVPSDDLDPPAAPAAPELLDVSGERVRFRWAAPQADDLHRYLILRGEAADELEVIGISDVEVYLDATVTAGVPYVYAIAAQDTAYNVSEPSDVLEVTAEERVVDVTFTVTVPEYTTPGDTIYIAGDFQGWNPGGDPMAQLDDTTWTITLPFVDATRLEYKYARGSWEAVEKDAGCGEIANRTLNVEYGSGGTQEVADSIEKWRDLDECP